jgi:spore coat polysaccharide biosynthesis protein SpsF
MPRVIATIEARMSATRLPGKVLLPILGEAVLARLIERVRRASLVDDVVIATTVNPADIPVVELAHQLKTSVFRGSEEDVMGRVLGAAQAHNADIIVELTGDNPLIDPATIDRMVATYLEGGTDYVANVLERSYPLGMDTQVFSTATLQDAAGRTDDPLHREHVSLFIYRNPQLYRLTNLVAPKACHWPELRLTLDTRADYEMISRCYESLYPQDAGFDLPQIIAFFRQNPELAEHNAAVAHKWV